MHQRPRSASRRSSSPGLALGPFADTEGGGTPPVGSWIPVLIVLLFPLTKYETITTVPWAFPPSTTIDVVGLAAAALATLPITGRLVRVTRREDGTWFYQYGIELIGFYLGLWVVRPGLVLYFGPASIEIAIGLPTVTLSATASDVPVLIQGLFAIRSGLVFGRGVATYQLYERA